MGPRKVQALTEKQSPISKKKKKRELQSFVGILNHQSKFSPMTAEVFKPLWKMTLVKVNWTGNGMCQDLYDKVKNMVKKMHI